MKKNLALVLALMLLVSCACAENTTCTYVSETGLFSFSYPDSYIPVSSTTADELLADPATKELFDEAGFDPSSLKTKDSTLLESLYRPDFMSNMNVVSQPGIGLNMVNIKLMQNTLVQLYAEQYTSLGAESFEFLGFPEFGGNAYMGMRITIYGLNMEQYLICDKSGTLCILTFTAFDEAARDMILSSFAFAG